MKKSLLFFGLFLFSVFLIPGGVFAYQGPDLSYCYDVNYHLFYGNPYLGISSSDNEDFARVLRKFGDRVDGRKDDESDMSLSKFNYFSNSDFKKNFVFYSNCVDVRKLGLNFDGLEIYGFTGTLLDYKDLLKQFPYYYYYKTKTLPYEGESINIEYFIFSVTDNITVSKLENLDGIPGTTLRLSFPNADSKVKENKPLYLVFTKVRDGQSFSLFNLQSFNIASSPDTLPGGTAIPLSEDIDLKDLGSLPNFNSNMNFIDDKGNTIINDTYKENDFSSTSSSSNNKKYNEFNTPTSLDGFIKKIPEMIKTLAASFSLIGVMITTVFDEFPPLIVTCLYSTFLLGIIILILKALR